MELFRTSVIEIVKGLQQVFDCGERGGRVENKSSPQGYFELYQDLKIMDETVPAKYDSHTLSLD